MRHVAQPIVPVVVNVPPVIGLVVEMLVTVPVPPLGPEVICNSPVVLAHTLDMLPLARVDNVTLLLKVWAALKVCAMPKPAMV